MPASRFAFSWRDLLPILVVFVALRFLRLRAFPFFNDEANLTLWAQQMASDWGRFKWLSMRNEFGDWKPPIAFWAASVGLRFVEDPLLAVRLAPALVSTIGVVSAYVFSGHLFQSRKIALWAAVLWTLNPMTLFYDRECVTETFVYSFAAGAYALTLLAITRHRGWAVPAAVLAACSMLSKQSGLLYGYELVFFAALLVSRRPRGEDGPRVQVDVRGLVALGAILLGALALYRLVIPGELFAEYRRPIGNFMYTVPEMLRFPLKEWSGNVARILALFRSYYSPLALILVGFFAWRCATRRHRREVMVLAWLALGTVVMIVYFRYWNEYMFHTSNVLFLTVALAVAVVDVGERAARLPWPPVRRAFAMGGAGTLLTALWILPLPWFYTSPATYIERFGTEAMNWHYRNGWPSGFGTERAMELLARERPSVVLLDPQWGNPRSAVEAVAPVRFPQHRLVPMTYVALQLVERADPSAMIAIFRLYPGDTRWRVPGLPPLDQLFMQLPLCRSPLYLSPPGDTPLVYCRY